MWTTCKIGDVCTLMTGGTPDKKETEYFEGGEIPWLVSGDIHQREIFDCEGRITDLGYEKSNAKYLPLNSVMIALNGQGKTRGTVALLRTKATCNQSLVSIIPNDLDQLLPEYLYHQLSWRYEEIRKMTGDSGNDRRGLNMSLIRSIDISFPLIIEQNRIVAILDEAFEGIDAAIANTEANLTNAGALFASYLDGAIRAAEDAFPTKPLKDLCEEDRLITYGVIKLGPNTEDGTPCLRTSNVRWLRIETDQLKKISPTLSDQYSRTILRGEEILVNVRGTLGGVAVVPPHMAGWNISREVALVPVDTKQMDSGFLSFVIASKRSQDWLTGVLKGAAYTGINLGDLRNLPVPFADLTVQRSIASKIELVLEDFLLLETNYEQKLSLLSELKQSILAKAFSGELTRQEAA